MPKVNIHSPAGLDAFIDHLADGAPVVLADMGAGSGQVTYEWFETMYPDIADARIAFTTIGVVTSDPASVESVLSPVVQAGPASVKLPLQVGGIGRMAVVECEADPQKAQDRASARGRRQ